MALDLTSLSGLLVEICTLSLAERVDAINRIRLMVHAVSPFRHEPVDCVLWERNDTVRGNPWNPNSVAPPEMELLRVSIMEDGYTQPIVAWRAEDMTEVVDGFHRHRVGKECAEVQQRVQGYLPLVIVNETRADRGDRIASTIRHNRARGKHQVEAMSDIVIELKRRNWTNERISRELGMDEDEILRLCQLTGLMEMFGNTEFSKSWDVEGEITESDYVALTDGEVSEDDPEYRAVNTDDPDRIFHTYEKWECHKAGFYASSHPTLDKGECEEKYREFLSDIPRFEAALMGVVTTWCNSCEHYLTNAAMNRIAWLGQASACYAMQIPAAFRSGFFLLTEPQQDAANEAALRALNMWLAMNGRQVLTMKEAYSGRQSDIY